MIIVFDKVSSTAKPIEVSFEGILLKGTLKKSGYHQITLDAVLSGSLELDCDRCGDTYDYAMDSKLILRLSDLLSEDKDDLDIIEFLDGKIDILYILESEINALKGSYHYCEKCNNSDKAFEIEY
ncbi:hypothetical protein MNB_SV-3-407 [hydrothermal vent metagenome]|uniref:DUF177 domain-containing protein n=1 Tax=hydrothermal vent metagenome TaxID=652676 RepID=A0A1W1CXL7_9ZZZZ